MTTLKYDSGDIQNIAHAVLTAKFSHVIAFYCQACTESNYTPLSDSSLLRILKAMKPSQRKSLAGLNDTAAAAMNGIGKLQELSRKFGSKTCEDSLERCKRYLKTGYQLHCSDPENRIPSHSAEFALSDPNNNKLHAIIDVSEEVCYECNELCEVLQTIQDLAKEHTADNDTIYDIDVAVNHISDYVKHLMRDVQQRKAKSDAFLQLDNETAFWLKDFSQKILPVKFREGQKEYFGKKGMSMHIDVFISQHDGKLKKHVYVSLIYRCEQGTSSIISIADAVLDQFQEDEPAINKLLAKFDNAGCYHGNYSAEGIYGLCKKKNIELRNYDYNEPQCGKDQCDRESTAAKTIIRSYVDAGNDIVTAEDALHYDYGLKNAKVSMVKIENSLLKGPKISKISDYHSIEFLNDHMKLWRYYGIGEGIEQPYNNLDVQPCVEIVKSFNSTDKHPGGAPSAEKKRRKDRDLCTLFFCNAVGCCASFCSKNELEEHTFIGQHGRANERSSFDTVRNVFVNKMKSLSQVHTCPFLTTSQVTAAQPVDNEFSTIFKNVGWALPTRSNFRYTNKQKQILYRFFIAGEESGKKMSPEEVQLLLRKELVPEEYVSVQSPLKFFMATKKGAAFFHE